MNVQEFDVLNVNVVLVGLGLLNSPDELEAFQSSIDAEVRSVAGPLVVGVSTASLETGRRYELPRERVSLDSSSGRTTVQREYPTKDDLERLSKIVSCAIEHTDLQNPSPRAFGFNIELVYDQTSGNSAIQYLGERLFGGQDLGVEDMELVGGSGRMVLDSPAGRWAVQVEPRFGDEQSSRVFMSVNYHKQEQRIPKLDEIRQHLHEIWEMAKSFAAQIDQRAL